MRAAPCQDSGISPPVPSARGCGPPASGTVSATTQFRRRRFQSSCAEAWARVRGGQGRTTNFGLAAVGGHDVGGWPVAVGEQDPQDSELDKIGPEILYKGEVNLVVDPALELNAVIFSCGLGDGVYPTWAGRTSTGELACFVADLDL